MPKNLEELNSLQEWPKRISSGEERVGLRAGKGILDLLGWAIGEEWSEDDFDCGDERQDGDAGRWSEETVVAAGKALWWRRGVRIVAIIVRD